MTTLPILLGAAVETVKQDLGHIGPTAKVFFFVFIALSLGITYWAARRTKSTSDFYAAGHSVTGVQNGFALAGDFMSAARRAFSSAGRWCCF